jgi:hypothetical protein
MVQPWQHEGQGRLSRAPMKLIRIQQLFFPHEIVGTSAQEIDKNHADTAVFKKLELCWQSC